MRAFDHRIHGIRGALLGGVMTALNCLVPATRLHAQAVTRPLPPAAEIIARHVGLVDSGSVFATAKSFHSVSDLEVVGSGIKGSVESFSARPGKMFSRISLGPIGQILQGFDGSVGWTINPSTGPSLSDSSQLVRMRHLTNFDHPLHRPTDYKSMETIELKEFDGVLCYRIHLVGTGGFEFDEFYDQSTGLRRGLTYRDGANGGSAPVTITYDAYKSFDGLLTATVVTQKGAGPVLKQSLRSVERNAAADSVFVLPAVIRGLLGR
jgi:hypothetical protein